MTLSLHTATSHIVMHCEKQSTTLQFVIKMKTRTFYSMKLGIRLKIWGYI